MSRTHSLSVIYPSATKPFGSGSTNLALNSPDVSDAGILDSVIPTFWIMIAEKYGIGRSMLGDLLFLMYGRNNAGTADFRQIMESEYDNWCEPKRLLICEEALEERKRTASPRRVYEKLKTFFDTRPVTKILNPKFKPQYEATLYFNMLVFSNNSDAMTLPADDRRVTVLSNATHPRDMAYYKTLASLSKDKEEARRLYSYLMTRDVSNFNHAKPLATAAKDRMREETKSVYETIHDEALNNLDTITDVETYMAAVEFVMIERDIEPGYLNVYRDNLRRMYNKLEKLRLVPGDSNKLHIGSKAYRVSLTTRLSGRTPTKDFLKQKLINNRKKFGL